MDKATNKKLSRQRELRGWSQEKLAQEVGTTSKIVGRWERGECKPTPYYRQKLVQIFGKNVEELGFMDKGTDGEIFTLSQEETNVIAPSNKEDALQQNAENAHQPIHLFVPTGLPVVTVHLHQQTAMHTDTHNAGNGIIHVETRRTSELASLMPLQSRIETGDTDDMDRREATKAIGSVGATFLVAQEFFNVETWERLSHSLAKKPSRVDQTLMHGLQKTVENYWELHLLGSIAFPDLLHCVLGHLQVVLRLLHNPQSLSTTIRLHSLASETAQLAGDLMFGMGQRDAAKSCYQFSFDTAREANNTSLAAIALGRLSMLPATQNNPAEALALLQEAQRLARPQNAFTLCAWLRLEEAEAHADLGKQKHCLTALEDAENLVSQIQAGEDTYGICFNRSRLQAYQGSCHIRLQQPETALPTLIHSLHSPESPEVFRGSILIDIAKASILMGDIEQACSYLCQPLDFIHDLNFTRLLEDIHKIRQQLDPWSTVQVVKDLDEKLHYF